MLSQTPRPALVLGFAGLIPFWFAAACVWLAPAPWNVHALQIQVLYAATILSFLGAVHWGLAVANYGGAPATSDNPAPAMTWSRLGWSVVQVWSAAAFLDPFAGEGVRVSIGAPDENDAFLAALDAVRGRQPGDAPLR